MTDANRDTTRGSSIITPRMLLAAYSHGIFPMARGRNSRGVDWYCPDPRAILPLDGFRCPRSLRQRLARGQFEFRHDTAFREVMVACSKPRPGHPETWINRDIIDAYCDLHRMGCAHSVETWMEGQLVGGLYGVRLGGAFFGESMFHRPKLGGTDASKAALAHLVEHLRRRGFTLLDVQIQSSHMARFGTIEIPHHQYVRLLNEALAMDVTWSDGPAGLPSDRGTVT